MIKERKYGIERICKEHYVHVSTFRIMLKITIHPCFFGATQFTIQSVICLIGLDKSLLSTTLEYHSKQFNTISLTILARNNLPSTPVNPVCWLSKSHSAFSQGCHNTFTCGNSVGGCQCPQTVMNGDSEWRTGIYQWRLRMAHRNLPDSTTMPWMCRQERVFWYIILNFKRPRNIPKQLTLFCMRIKSNHILLNYCSTTCTTWTSGISCKIHRRFRGNFYWFLFSDDDVIKWNHFPRYWPFVREFTGPRWIPRTKASDAELWCFLWSASE